MTQLLAVGLGGFLGAVSRYLLSGYMNARFEGAFPYGTLAANVLGCFGIGILFVLVEDSEWLSENGRLFLVVGLLGSLTTFSTFGLETITLWKAGEVTLSALSILANVVVGIGAVLAGRALMRALL